MCFLFTQTCIFVHLYFTFLSWNKTICPFLFFVLKHIIICWLLFTIWNTTIIIFKFIKIHIQYLSIFSDILNKNISQLVYSETYISYRLYIFRVETYSTCWFLKRIFNKKESCNTSHKHEKDKWIVVEYYMKLRITSYSNNYLWLVWWTCG